MVFNNVSIESLRTWFQPTFDVLLLPSFGALVEGDPFLGFLLRLPERTRREGGFDLFLCGEYDLPASGVSGVTLPAFAYLYVPVFSARGRSTLRPLSALLYELDDGGGNLGGSRTFLR